MLLGMYLSKDDGLPEAALFDRYIPSNVEGLRVLVLPNCGCNTGRALTNADSPNRPGGHCRSGTAVV